MRSCPDESGRAREDVRVWCTQTGLYWFFSLELDELEEGRGL